MFNKADCSVGKHILLDEFALDTSSFEAHLVQRWVFTHDSVVMASRPVG